MQNPTNKDKQTKNILIKNKRVIGHEVFMAYLDFNAPFETHTNASKVQIGAFISQKGQANHFLFMTDEHLPTKIYHN